MNLPGSPRTHVWMGLIIALAGIGVGGWAYTGPRVYRIEFLFAALMGFLLVLGGSLLTGVGQANRPRMGGRKAARKSAKAKAQTKQASPSSAGGTDEAVTQESESSTSAKGSASLVTRLRAWTLDRLRGDEVTAVVSCPLCDHVFEATGQPPFETVCPSCQHQDEVHEPLQVATKAEPVEVRGSPGNRSAGSGTSEAPHTSDASERPRQKGGVARRLRDRLARAGSDRAALTLACEHCETVFTAQGQPPLAVTCPHCGYAGRVEL